MTVLKTLEAVRPTVVINCAASHNVEACERQEEHAFAVNACAVKRLAERCAQLNARLVHLSTNYVFDGTAAEPYREALCRIRRALRDLEACRRARGAVIRPGSAGSPGAGLYGLRGSASKGELRHQDALLALA